MTHLSYLWYMIRHRFWVFVGGVKLWKAGVYLSPIRLLLHDLSKFGPKEWNAYRRRFYDRTFGTPEDFAQFDAAWLAHQNSNDHHWNHWVIIREDGRPECLRMPEQALREMVADWYGAGKTIHGRNEVVEWYEGQRDKGYIRLHRQTRQRVEELLGLVGTRKVIPEPVFFQLRESVLQEMMN